MRTKELLDLHKLQLRNIRLLMMKYVDDLGIVRPWARREYLRLVEQEQTIIKGIDYLEKI